ncbi:MAG: VWA domain-containing protein [Vicinamibacterales bacterium]
MLAVVFALGLFAQGEAEVPDPPPVRIHVAATDASGEDVRDLDATEFRIVENGEARRVESARLVDQAGQESTRIVGIFLDDYHVSAGRSAERIRAALEEFVTSQLGPGDLVAVVRPLDSLLRITATPDRDAVREAIRSFEGRKGLFEPRNDFEQDFIASSPARVEAIRSQISTSALNALIKYVGELGEGRKAVLVASEGFLPEPPRRGGALPTVDGAVRRANQTGVVVHVLDPQDRVEQPADDGRATVLSERQTLLTLAEATGGILMSGVDSWRSGLARVDADLSRYYVLEFAAGSRRDGRFHEIDVSVVRPAVTVKAPSGYWSRPPADRRLTAAAARAGGAPAPLPIRRTSGLIRPWFGVARTGDGRARVSFVWEAVPTVPSRPLDRRLPPARVILRATTTEGESVFERAVTAVEGQTQTALAVFDVPPGRLRLEMSIEDANAVALDTDVRDLTIRAPGGPVALGTAAVFRARTAREMRQIRDDPNAVPAASREFRSAEQLLVRVPAYAASTPTVSAVLVSRAGRIMRELSAVPGPSADAQQIEVPLAGLPAGEYRLELTAAHDGLTASQAIDIRVVP